MQPVTQHAICQVNECNGGNVCWGNINFDGYRVERGSSGEGAADGGCVSYTSSGFWPYFASAFGAANWESPLPLGGERQLLLHSFCFVVAHCGALALLFGVSPLSSSQALSRLTSAKAVPCQMEAVVGRLCEESTVDARIRIRVRTYAETSGRSNDSLGLMSHYTTLKIQNASKVWLQKVRCTFSVVL